MLETKQVAIYLGGKDRDRLDRLAKLVTPLNPNKSKMVQMALLYSDTRLDDFTSFVSHQTDAKEWLIEVTKEIKKAL